MALPPAEELSRWTVSQVSDWLSKSSLTAFRDHFLKDGIDGRRLMNLTEGDIDSKYKQVASKKRNVLKGHLKKIEASRPPPSWNANAPHLPPRPGGGGGPRIPPAPLNFDDDDDLSEDDWGDEFDDSFEEYLEPTPVPHQPPRPGLNINGQSHRPPPPPPAEPQSEYEIPEETLQSQPIQRKGSLVDKLRSELAIRQSTDQDPVAPPPRPPRGRTLTDPRNTDNHRGHHPLPPPTETRQNVAPAEEVYEIMNEPEDRGDGVYLSPDASCITQNSYLDFSETCKAQHTPVKDPPKPTPVEPPPPPRPQKKISSTERPDLLPPQPGTKTKQDDLSQYPWYHGKIGRDQATKIFEREQRDGMFLIRKSERDAKQPYTLVIWQSNRIWNIPIRKLDNEKYAAGKFKQGETQFTSIVDLVEHFKVVSLSLKSSADQVEGTNKLTIPAPKR